MAADGRLDGHVALVTGGTSGIGAEIVRELAASGATVLVHGRDREKGERLVAAVETETGNDGLSVHTADFTDFEAVRALAAEVREAHDSLDVLVNNAGTWQGERRLVEVPAGEAVEFTFAVNHLAHFLLTALLADRLAASDADPARVVTTSSQLHQRATFDLDAVVGPEGPTGVDAYAHSKLANVLFTAELARRLPKGVVANACHPGTAPATALARDGRSVAGLVWKAFGVVGRFLPWVVDSPAAAAETPVYLARSPETADASGAYFADCERREASWEARDRDAQQRLWIWSVERLDVAVPPVLQR
jgi:NAD(P)-dependent dehydrogenase (short-subunit alcohol dehydrogenase family)